MKKYIWIIVVAVLVIALFLLARGRGAKQAAPSPTAVILVSTATPTRAPTAVPRTAVPPTTASPTVLSPTAVPTNNPIVGIVWQWTNLKIQTTGETTYVPNPDTYTIIFGAEGAVTGQADCNPFSGTYSQQNGFAIKIKTTTTAYCGEASLDRQYLQLLGDIAAGGSDGAGNLALETAGGEQRMLFTNGGAAN